jgi:hypothetical protein
MCRSGCKTQDHPTWGACARAARLSIGHPEGQAWAKGDAEVDQYKQARRDGLEPSGIYPEHVEAAYRMRDFEDTIPEGYLESEE